MKKVILTVTTVVLATIAVHAQSAGAEVRIMSQSWRGAFAKNQARQAEAATKIRKSNLAARVTQQVQRQQAQQTLACGTATQAPGNPQTLPRVELPPRRPLQTKALSNSGSKPFF